MSIRRKEFMYQGCTNLKACPSIAAIHMAPYCYESMFRGCTSLLTPAALPAQLAREAASNIQMYKLCRQYHRKLQRKFCGNSD